MSENPFAEEPTSEDNTQPNSASAPFEEGSFTENIHNQNEAQSQITGEQVHGGAKYNIRDLYWLINDKLYKKEPLTDHEAGMVTLTYNADFDNLKFTFYRINSSVFSRKGAAILENAEKLTIFNFHSETCDHLLYEYYRMDEVDGVEKLDKIYNFERVFKENQNWHPNLTKTEINSPKSITVKTSDNSDGSLYLFEFRNWQVSSLLKACEFMTNGTSFQTGLFRRIAGNHF